MKIDHLKEAIKKYKEVHCERASAHVENSEMLKSVANSKVNELGKHANKNVVPYRKIIIRGPGSEG